MYEMENDNRSCFEFLPNFERWMGNSFPKTKKLQFSVTFKSIEFEILLVWFVDVNRCKIEAILLFCLTWKSFRKLMIFLEFDDEFTLGVIIFYSKVYSSDIYWMSANFKRTEAENMWDFFQVSNGDWWSLFVDSWLKLINHTNC